MLVQACQKLSPRKHEITKISHAFVETDPAPPHSPRSLRSFFSLSRTQSSHIAWHTNPLSSSEGASSNSPVSSKISFSFPPKLGDDHPLQPVIAYLTQEQKSDPLTCAQAIWTYCSRYPEKEKDNARAIAKIMTTESPHHKKRIKPLLYHLFLNHKKALFFSFLLKEMHVDFNEIAKFLVKEILPAESGPLLLINLIGKHTECDLKDAPLETLFRSANFSSSLCKFYGIYTNQEQLTLFYQFLRKKFDSLSGADLKKLQIEPRHMQEACPGAERSELMEKALQNFATFSQFISEALDALYKIQFSPFFIASLSVRRKKIEQFLVGKCSDPFQGSRIYIGETLFLRFLCAELLLIIKDPKKLIVMVALVKFLQQLTNEVLIGGIEPDPIQMELNALYQRFLSRHQEFIDYHSSSTIT